MNAAPLVLAALLTLPGLAAPPLQDPPGAEEKDHLDELLAWINRTEATEPQATLKAAMEGIQRARQKGDPVMEAAFLSCVAYSSSQTGDFSQAVQYADQALAMATKLGNKERMAKAHNILGITYTFMGSYSRALDEGLQALRIREELGLESAILQSMNLIGVIYHHSGQYDKAIDYYEQILARIGDRPDWPRIILSNLNIGFAKYKQGRFREALEHHLKALDLSRKAPDTPYIAYAYVNLGLTYTDLGDYPEADRYLHLALGEYRKHDQKHGKVQVFNALARLDLLTRHSGDGIRWAEQGADLARQINARDELKTSYQLLSELHEKRGDIARSLAYFKLYSNTKDALFTDQESEKIANLSMNLVTLRKDSEIAALKQERIISALSLQKERYFSVLLASGVVTLTLSVLALLAYGKKTRDGKRLLEAANDRLQALNGELQENLREIKTLSGLLPICAKCKKIRDDDGYWQQLEGYISKHTSATFSHGICPHCADELYPDVMLAKKDRIIGG